MFVSVASSVRRCVLHWLPTTHRLTHDATDMLRFLYTIWNNTDIPLAFLITFRCYGTWLHGDERGSIDRNHNQYKSPYRQPNQQLQKFSTRLLKSKPVNLDAQKREFTELAIREVCDYRNWLLRAVNVRTNHVHLVVSIGDTSPSKALNSFKAYATRKLRENNCWEFEHSPWAEKGSKRHLWNERSIEIAVDYVVNGQGGDLPSFD
jgi:REP element-mobilizing transposase RayT